MTETHVCAYCNTSEHAIDVRGYRYLESGTQVSYEICHHCCTLLRRFHFNNEPEKMKLFWNSVWKNLSLDECIEPIEEMVASVQAKQQENASTTEEVVEEAISATA